MDSTRDTEAAWLRGAMNKAGLSNLALAERLTALGWEGTPSIISSWRNGTTPIPDKLVPIVVHALGQHSDKRQVKQVVNFLARRHEWLRPYLRPVGEESDAPAKTRPATIVLTPAYYARRGKYAGVRFIPWRDSNGSYVAGRTRFKKDERVFDDMDSLIRALSADPGLQIRMVPETAPDAPPTLIQSDSIIWDHVPDHP